MWFIVIFFLNAASIQLCLNLTSYMCHRSCRRWAAQQQKLPPLHSVKNIVNVCKYCVWCMWVMQTSCCSSSALVARRIMQILIALRGMRCGAYNFPSSRSCNLIRNGALSPELPYRTNYAQPAHPRRRHTIRTTRDTIRDPSAPAGGQKISF